jgi:MazG family protein
MSSSPFERLLATMARLRDPGGCPWDREQTLETLRPYLIEETYEVIDAIDRKDWSHLPEELGDLQLQIVFQAQIAAEDKLFTIDDVLTRINDKLIRRHPHVFGDESARTAGDVVHRWEQIKAEEKLAKDGAGNDATAANRSILDGIPRAQPALLEAAEIGKKAAKAGFDWPEFAALVDKLHEEIGELLEARESGRQDHVEEEIGDLLFMLVNIARHSAVHPELALRRANAKFRERFRYIEEQLEQRGKPLAAAGLDEMEELWQQAKNS